MTEYQLADCQKVLEKFCDDMERWRKEEHIDFRGQYRHCIKEAAEEIHLILSST